MIDLSGLIIGVEKMIDMLADQLIEYLRIGLRNKYLNVCMTIYEEYLRTTERNSLYTNLILSMQNSVNQVFVIQRIVTVVIEHWFAHFDLSLASWYRSR